MNIALANILFYLVRHAEWMRVFVVTQSVILAICDRALRVLRLIYRFVVLLRNVPKVVWWPGSFTVMWWLWPQLSFALSSKRTDTLRTYALLRHMGSLRVYIWMQCALKFCKVDRFDKHLWASVTESTMWVINLELVTPWWGVISSCCKLNWWVSIR